MVFINLYNIAKKQINKSSFKQKNIISFQAYELLKQYVVKGLVNANVLDSAYPKNTRLKVLKNVSQRSMHTFYKLSDKSNCFTLLIAQPYHLPLSFFSLIVLRTYDLAKSLG